MDHVEDRISGLEDKVKTLKNSVKVNNKLMFAIMFFWGKNILMEHAEYWIYHTSPNLLIKGIEEEKDFMLKV